MCACVCVHFSHILSGPRVIKSDLGGGVTRVPLFEFSVPWHRGTAWFSGNRQRIRVGFTLIFLDRVRVRVRVKSALFRELAGS